MFVSIWCIPWCTMCCCMLLINREMVYSCMFLINREEVYSAWLYTVVWVEGEIRAFFLVENLILMYWEIRYSMCWSSVWSYLPGGWFNHWQ